MGKKEDVMSVGRVSEAEAGKVEGRKARKESYRSHKGHRRS